VNGFGHPYGLARHPAIMAKHRAASVLARETANPTGRTASCSSGEPEDTDAWRRDPSGREEQ